MAVSCQRIHRAFNRTREEAVFLKLTQRADKHPSIGHIEPRLHSGDVTFSVREHHQNRGFPLAAKGLHPHRQITPLEQARSVPLLCRCGRAGPYVKIVRLVHRTFGLNIGRS